MWGPGYPGPQGKLNVMSKPPTRWTDRLAFEIALMLEGSGELLPDILVAHKLEDEDIEAFSKDPVFEKKVEGYREDIRTNGLTFRLKARTQAEVLLDTAYELIHDVETTGAVKADLIKSIVRWGGLESKTGEGAQGPRTGVAIQINFSGQNSPNRETLTITAAEDLTE